MIQHLHIHMYRVIHIGITLYTMVGTNIDGILIFDPFNWRGLGLGIQN
jgi:hypothetical protein